VTDAQARYPATYAAERPDDPAVVMASTGAVETWRELDERSSAVARALRDLGLGRGDHVALVMENHPAFFDVMWAVLRAGMRYTAVNTYLKAEEATEVLRACRTSVIVTSTGAAALVREACGSLDPVPPVAVVRSRAGDDPPPGGWALLDELVAAASPQPVVEAEGAPLWFSSGTSGRPKAVVRPLPDCPPGHGDPVARHYAEAFGLDGTTVHLGVGPLHHAAPVGFSTAAHRAGGTVVLAERFDPVELLRWIERYGITSSHLVPTMFVRLLKLPEDERRGHDLSSLRTVIHGAAPCPVDVKRRMIDWWGPVIVEYYGGTEGVGSTIVSSEEWLARPGTVGRASRGTIHVAGDDGEELPPGQDGLVWFENPDFTARYQDDPDETAAISHPRGWQTLGDIGHVDDDGYLFLTDRWSHKIVTGGVNVFPREVEDVLLGHPSVLDVAVIGIPHDDMGEEVRAVVQVVGGVVADHALADRLVAWCRARLAHVKCPRAVDFVGSLPRSENGKLYKRLLRDRYWSGRDRRI
jgi:long-chain acyl-CoA synthetase